MKAFMLIILVLSVGAEAMSADFSCKFSVEEANAACPVCGGVGVLLKVSSLPSSGPQTQTKTIGRFSASITTQQGGLAQISISDSKSGMSVASGVAVGNTKSVEIKDATSGDGSSLSCNPVISLPQPQSTR